MAGLPGQDCFASRVMGKNWQMIKEVPRHVSLPSTQGSQMFFNRFGTTKSSWFPYSSLGCSIALGGAIFRSASAFGFYGRELNIFTLIKRICGGLIMLISCPLFFLENRFTKHPSRFVIYAQKS